MGFTDFGDKNRSLTNEEAHQFIDYTPRTVTGNPNDTWKELTGNQTGQVKIEGYMNWLCANGYFKKDSPNCASGDTP